MNRETCYTDQRRDGNPGQKGVHMASPIEVIYAVARVHSARRTAEFAKDRVAGAERVLAEARQAQLAAERELGAAEAEARAAGVEEPV